MASEKEDPEGAAAAALTGSWGSLLGGLNPSETSPAHPGKQAPPSCGIEALCEACREERRMLFAEIAARAETGILYCDLDDERGLRYAVSNIVNLAVRLGDELAQLRHLRENRHLDGRRL